MAYNTVYTIEILEGSKDLIRQLRLFSKEAAYGLDDNGQCRSECRWVNRQKELGTFSKLHPEAVIQLHGDGDSEDDNYYEYYKNGKIQICPREFYYLPYEEQDLETIEGI